MGFKSVPKGRRRNEMTHAQLTMADLPKLFVGFDRLQDDLFNQAFNTGYPRYNVVKIDAGKQVGYRIELAVPGWDKSDISIELHKNVLTIKGESKQAENQAESYMHKGLSGKCFTRNFRVGEFIVLSKAYMDRGLLCIDLDEEVPEKAQPVKVEIG